MKIELKELQEFEKIKYYTIQIENEDRSETQKFVDRFKESEYRFEFEVIFYHIKKMGEKRGADERFFRYEREAHALPPYFEGEGGNLRLYCIRISNDIVILGNGGVKTADTYQDSPDCKPHIELLLNFNFVFTQHVKEGEITIEEKNINAENYYFDI